MDPLAIPPLPSLIGLIGLLLLAAVMVATIYVIRNWRG